MARQTKTQAENTTATPENGNGSDKVEYTYVNVKLTAAQAFVLDKVAAMRGQKQIDYLSTVVVDALKRDADPAKIREHMERQLAALGDFAAPAESE